MKTLKFIAILAVVTIFFVYCASKLTVDSGKIHQFDDSLVQVIDTNQQIEIIADGFEWSEGPVWDKKNNCLYFSDIPQNTIYKWSENEGIEIFLRPSGYNDEIPSGSECGTNGLLFDAQGRLVMCDHGMRRISRLNTKKYTKDNLADNYNGKRFNSPNDAVYNKRGDLFFTDPPYGLKGLNQSPDKELDFNGVYCLRADSTLILLTNELSFPNGIALSPDEKILYIANSDPEYAFWMAYELNSDCTIANSSLFFDARDWVKEGKAGLPDGMTIDEFGNLFATGPGGVHIFDPGANHLGTIEVGQPVANCAFGEDGKTLFMTADMLLCKVRTKSSGLGF